jgi:type IV secretion system protein VirD4
VTTHTKMMIAELVVALLAVWFVWWAFVPRWHAPHFRVFTLAARLALHLHPGRGFASSVGCWWRWGRWASFRESKRTRPGVGFWERLTSPQTHSIYVGLAHYWLHLRLTIQEHVLVPGPPRMFKSAFLGRVILHYPGAVVSTSTKADMFRLTSGVRQQPARPGRLFRALLTLTYLLPFVQHRPRCGEPRPVYVFNPGGIGGIEAASNIRWNLVEGCDVESVAMRRAKALCEAVSTGSLEDSSFWAEQAALMLRCLLCAAALVPGGTLQLVAWWILTGETQGAEQILSEHKYETWARTIGQMRGPAERTTATIRMILTQVVGFMADPTLASCVLPSPGEEFSIEDFLSRQGTLYLIGESRGMTSPLAPLFAGLVNEVHFVAAQIGSRMPGGRLDPPVAFVLDEVTQICPIPLPSLLADSGGIGIQMIIACHGVAQLRGRWQDNGARSVLDTTSLLLMPGVSDPATLELASKLCGEATYHKRGSKEREQLPVATVGMINQLTTRYGLLKRSNAAPVIVRLPLAWRAWQYRVARWRRRSVAFLPPVLPASGVVPGSVEHADAIAQEGSGAPDPGRADAASAGWQPDREPPSPPADRGGDMRDGPEPEVGW